LIKFISEGQVTENLILVQGKLLQVLAQEFHKGVGEEDLSWRLCFEATLSMSASCLAVTSRHQVVVGSGATLVAYLTYVQSENLFHYVSKFQQPRPLYHPACLIELIATNQRHLVDLTLTKLSETIQETQVTRRLGLPIQVLFEEPKAPPVKESTDLDWLFGSSPVQAPQRHDDEPSSLTLSQVQQLKAALSDLSQELPGVSENLVWLRQLLVVIDAYYTLTQQTRSMDEFASLFYLYVKLHKFAIDAKQPTKGLSSREVAWALHSEQQDTLFALCFNEPLDWSSMRRYGMGVWVQQLSSLKQLVEGLAKREYMKSRQAETVFIWYLALNKKSVLQGLYKAEPSNHRIWEFISRDFSEERSKVAALKNAFELRKTRRFEMSAGFFLLAGELRKAADVLGGDQNDAQEALTVCRLVEGGLGPVSQYVVEKYFLEPATQNGDPWMASIACSLLGRHVESVKALYTQREYRHVGGQLPTSSAFHPSLLYLGSLLKNTLKVKRELRGGSVTPPYTLSLASSAVLLGAGMPTLSLLSLTREVRSVDRTLTEQAVRTQLMLTLADTADSEITAGFPSLQHDIEFLSEEFNVPRTHLQEFVAEIFHKRDLRRHQCAFMVPIDPLKAAEAVLHLAATLHIIISRFSRDPAFEVRLESITEITDELRLCLELLGEEQDLETMQRRGCLLQITLGVFLGFFLSQYVQGDWTGILNTLHLLKDYFQGPNKLAYKALRFSEVSQPLKPDFSSTWLRFLAVSKLKSLLRSFDSSEVDEWMEQSLLKFNKMESKRNSLSKTMYFRRARRSLGPGRGIKKRPLMTIERLTRRCESWQMRLLMRLGRVPERDTEHWVDVFIKSSHTLAAELVPHFQDAFFYHTWMEFFEGSLKLHHLVKTSVPRLSPRSSALFGSGLEIFRNKSSVVDFAVNQCDLRQMAIVVNPCKRDGILEVNIETALKFRQRSAGLQVAEDNPDHWRENVQFSHDFEAFRVNPTLNFALQSLYPDSSLQFNDSLTLPPTHWHRVPLPKLLESLSGHKERSEEATRIAGHPMLPLYVTGNKSGRLTLWEYSRSSSLQDFGVVSSRVTAINFNSYGDKLGICDSTGNFFLYKFDLQPTSFQPQLSILAGSGKQASSFSFLNAGSVVATVGYKPKPFLTIYDTLLPTRYSAVHSTDCGGTIIHFLAHNSHLCIGDRKGRLVDFDLRKLEVVKKHSTQHELIKDIVSDAYELNIVTGGTDGTVKLWDASTLALKETVSVEAKKGRGITKLAFVSSALFVGTESGYVKLLRWMA
jgi:hypothetical protein